MLTIEVVSEAFEQWRKERSRTNEAVPSRLWEMAQSLSSHYNKRDIQKALRLNTPQYNKYLKPLVTQTKIESTMTDFAVGTFVPEQVISDEHCELTLQGANKSLRIKINIHHVAPVLSLIEHYL